MTNDSPTEPDYEHGGLSHAAAATVLSTAFITLVAAISYWTGNVLLAPSLGAAILTQVATPTIPSAKLWPIAVGQLCGLLGGICGVHLAAAAGLPPFTGAHPPLLPRVAAVAIAMPITGIAMFATRALCPVGGATALVVALGTETANWDGVWRLGAGIALVTALGEGARLAILHHRRLFGRP